MSMDLASIQKAAWKVFKDGILFHQPHRFMTFFQDFFDYVENSSNYQGWVNTTVGSSSVVITDERGGVVLITTGATENDGVQLQWKSEIFKLVDKKRLWFEVKLKISEKTQSDFLAGLCIRDTTCIAGVSDGVFFRKDDGNANIDIVTVKNTTATDDDDSGEDVVDDTYITLGFHWDGNGNISYFIDSILVGTHSTAANICQDEELAPVIAILTGAASAETLHVDYIKVIQER